MSKPFVPPLTSQEISQVFPNFDDIEIIKSGGEGTVAKGYDKKINTTVALKIYGPNHQETRTILEAEKLKTISNPFLVTLYYHNKISIRGLDCYYTETSFIDGSDLKTLLDNGYKFSYEDIVNVLICISSAIDALWSEHVVHCDIKPENILKHNDTYILIDLGIAKYLDESTMTQAGIIMGTYGYIAPEQLNGRKNLTQKADYYSLGITAYELITGYHPFNRNQTAMFTSDFPDFPDNLDVPNNLKIIIKKMMNKVPYLRPINATQIYNLIKEGE